MTLQINEWVIPIAATFSVIVPAGIFLGRSNVRLMRRQTIEDLEKMFEFAKSGEERIIIPSFEFVKYKYDPASRGADYAAEDVHTVRRYFLPVLLYTCMSFLGICLLFSQSDLYLSAFSLPWELWREKVCPASPPTSCAALKVHVFQAILGYTFLGSYVWTIQYLLRRIANYDLSPLSFFNAFARMLLGLIVSAVIWQSAAVTLSDTPLSIALAFILGYWPLAALDVIISRFPQLSFKRVNPKSKLLMEDLPLDLILGIDQFIKLRLSEFEIEDVQNLATTNPIQIFVETPYGLYEAIDWVSQAQLILGVGVEKVIALRALGVRTVFDLEKGLACDSLRRRMIAALLPGEPPPGARPERATSERSTSEYALGEAKTDPIIDPKFELDAVVSMIRDDLHVRRLRQIWDVINAKLEKRPDKVLTP